MTRGAAIYAPADGVLHETRGFLTFIYGTQVPQRHTLIFRTSKKPLFLDHEPLFFCSCTLQQSPAARRQVQVPDSVHPATAQGRRRGAPALLAAAGLGQI